MLCWWLLLCSSAFSSLRRAWIVMISLCNAVLAAWAACTPNQDGIRFHQQVPPRDIRTFVIIMKSCGLTDVYR